MDTRIAVLLVLDALGVKTLEYLLRQSGANLRVPNMVMMGLGGLLDLRSRLRMAEGIESLPGTYAARLDQVSATADSVIGHREMCGIIDARTYDLFPNGFDRRYIAELERAIGRRTMFNQMGGGVEVIEANAEQHARTGDPIVYASKCDPLIQLAMDESVIPVAEQHRIADIALATALEMGIPITRAIARAFVRTSDGEYVRTANRHDAVLALPGPTLVDVLRDQGIRVVSVGKPSDLVTTRFTQEFHLADRRDLDPTLDLRFPHPKGKDTNPFTVQGIVNAIAQARQYREGTFVFANCVDTDSLYGHTRDVAGALRCLEELDRVLPRILARLCHDDLLLITADHGMDHRSDYGYHSREPVPLLVTCVGHKDFPLMTGMGQGMTEVGMLIAQQFGCTELFRQAIVHVPA